MNTKYKKFMIIMIYILFIILICAITESIKTLDYYIWLRYFSLITIVQLFGNIVFLKFSNFKISSFISIIVMFLYFFSFGQLLIEGFFQNYFNILYSVKLRYSGIIYISSCNFCLDVIFSIVLGALIASLFSKDKIPTEKKFLCNDEFMPFCRPVGIFLLLVSFPAMLYFDIIRLKLSIISGYLSSFDVSIPGFVVFLSLMTLPAILLLIISFKNNKTATRLLLITFVLYKFIFMFAGARGQNVIFIFVLIYFYYQVIEKFSIKKLLFFAIAGFFLLLSLRAISYIRIESDKNIGVIVSAYGRALSNNAITENVYEFGFTLLEVCNVHAFMPNRINFANGATYFASLSTIFPNINGVLDSIINIAKWPIKVDKLYGGGTGGSLIAELYYNFFDYGVIFAVIIGVFLGKFSLSITFAIQNKKYFNIAVYSLIFFSAIWWIRDSFESMVRNTLWTYLLVMAVYYLMKTINSSSKDKMSTYK